MLLSVERLSVSIGPARPLDDVGFALAQGEILGIVGESGAGKSLTAMAVMGLLPLIGGRIDSGAVWFDGVDLARLPEEAYRKLRGRRIALIMQNPMTSLDPITRVGEQIDQVSRLHMGLDRAAARARSIELMAQLKIPEPAAVHDLYPHQLSGGMKQRAVIAMALAADPELIVADEPTTALDVSTQAQIIGLLKRLSREHGAAVMLITHDMGVIAETAHRVAVMYAGRIAEIGPVRAVLQAPSHPYTAGLMQSIPKVGATGRSLAQIDGTMPRLNAIPPGCAFHPRCPRRFERCDRERPDLLPTQDKLAACWLYPDERRP
jgi:oligopeptide/dipeptide ABC transporter ATP-binding protein